MSFPGQYDERHAGFGAVNLREPTVAGEPNERSRSSLLPLGNARNPVVDAPWSPNLIHVLYFVRR